MWWKTNKRTLLHAFTMANTRTKTTTVGTKLSTGLQAETIVKNTTTTMKRSVSPQAETVVKKAKKAAPKKGTWAPFDPSLPNNMVFPTKFDIPPKPENAIKIASYNVASLPACIKKGFNTYIDAEDADIICIQETKVNQPISTAVNDKVYKYRYWSFDEKKGYGKRKTSLTY